MEATLDAYPEWKIPCKVIATIPTADRQKSTVKVRVGFDKLDPRILPEMGIKVAFRESATSGAVPARVVAIPKSAVREADGRSMVLVVQNGRVERRALTLGATGPDDVTVSAGLAAGEKVVLDPPAALKEGARVEEAR